MTGKTGTDALLRMLLVFGVGVVWPILGRFTLSRLIVREITHVEDEAAVEYLGTVGDRHYLSLLEGGYVRFALSQRRPRHLADAAPGTRFHLITCVLRWSDGGLLAWDLTMGLAVACLVSLASLTRRERLTKALLVSLLSVMMLGEILSRRAPVALRGTGGGLHSALASVYHLSIMVSHFSGVVGKGIAVYESSGALQSVLGAAANFFNYLTFWGLGLIYAHWKKKRAPSVPDPRRAPVP